MGYRRVGEYAAAQIYNKMDDIGAGCGDAVIWELIGMISRRDRRGNAARIKLYPEGSFSCAGGGGVL